jgi:hypothetical protein
MKKLISICILSFILLLVNGPKIMAQGTETFKVGSYIDDAYIKKDLGDVSHYLHSQFIIRNLDNKVVYCLDPFISLDTNVFYATYNYDQANIAKLSSEQWQKIRALIYFGYKYSGHESNIWYSITQVAIWRYLRPDADIYFTDKLNGNKTNKYDAMLNELNSLANNYLKGVNIPEIIMSYKETKTITNDSFVGYQLNNNDSIATLKDSNLKIFAAFIGTKDYQMTKGDNNSLLFYNEASQRLVLSESAPEITSNIKITAISGHFAFHFIKPNDQVKCSSNTLTVYGLFNAKNQIIDKYTINKDFTIKSSELPYGKYHLVQLSHDCSVAADKSVYNFELKTNIYKVDINLAENKKDLIITKKYCQADNCQVEENAIFTLTNTDNNIKYSVTTDKQGIAKVSLKMGKYLIHQSYGQKEYEYAKDANINLEDYMDNEINLSLKDVIKKGNLKIKNLNEDGEPIANSSICLTNGIINLCNQTDKQGELLFNNINYGQYTIKQHEVTKPYILNNNNYLVNVNGSVTLKIINQKEIVETIKSNIPIVDNKGADSTNTAVIKKDTDSIITAEINKADNVIDNPETSVYNEDYLLILLILLIPFTMILIKQ